MQLCQVCPLTAFFAASPQLSLPLPAPAKPLGEAITSLLVAKETANFRPRYLDSLRQYLRAFAKGREDWPVASISVCTVETWFAGRKEALTTRRSNMGRLASLFTFCVRRGWMPANPCDALDKVRLDPKAPRILSVAEARTLLEKCRAVTPDLLPWLALGLFVGLRPEEAEKCDWTAVSLDAATVRVESVTSKVRDRRIVTCKANAVAWLRLGGELPLTRSTRRRWQRKLRDAMEWPDWPQDILRHTAASYSLGSGMTTAAVSDQFGNSPAILKGHYRELVTKEAAEAFFGILPG